MLSKCARRLLYSFAFFCFATSAASLALILILVCPDCALPNTFLVMVNGVAAILLFTIGISTLGMLIFHKGLQNTLSTQVVVSLIPAEDLEKSPAPVLPYNHIPHNSPFGEVFSRDLPDYFTTERSINEVETSLGDLPDYFTTMQNSNEVETSLTDLPDYFSIVQNVDGVYSSVAVDVEFLTESVPKTPPPCYEKALELILLEENSSSERGTDIHSREENSM